MAAAYRSSTRNISGADMNPSPSASPSGRPGSRVNQLGVTRRNKSQRRLRHACPGPALLYDQLLDPALRQVPADGQSRLAGADHQYVGSHRRSFPASRLASGRGGSYPRRLGFPGTRGVPTLGV
jgi:hypothetical protein